MPKTVTPGQIAYEGYCRCEYGPYMARADGPLTWGWSLLLDSERDAWEAAAQAVLARHTPPDDMRKYAATGGRGCPACGGADIANGNDTTYTGCAIRRVMLCEDCGAGWKAVYTLSGYEDLRLPIPEEGDQHAPNM